MPQCLVGPAALGTPAVLAHPAARGPQVQGEPEPCGILVIICAADLFPAPRRLLLLVPE